MQRVILARGDEPPSPLGQDRRVPRVDGVVGFAHVRVLLLHVLVGRVQRLVPRVGRVVRVFEPRVVGLDILVFAFQLAMVRVELPVVPLQARVLALDVLVRFLQAAVLGVDVVVLTLQPLVPQRSISLVTPTGNYDNTHRKIYDLIEHVKISFCFLSESANPLPHDGALRG